MHLARHHDGQCLNPSSRAHATLGPMSDQMFSHEIFGPCRIAIYSQNTPSKYFGELEWRWHALARFKATKVFYE